MHFLMITFTMYCARFTNNAVITTCMMLKLAKQQVCITANILMQKSKNFNCANYANPVTYYESLFYSKIHRFFSWNLNDY